LNLFAQSSSLLLPESIIQTIINRSISCPDFDGKQ
jgi:hypothetical protein